MDTGGVKGGGTELDADAPPPSETLTAGATTSDGQLGEGVDADAPPPPAPLTSAPFGLSPTPALSVQPYNPRDQALDGARKEIANWLLLMLGMIVLLAFIPILLLIATSDATKQNVEPIINVLNIVFGPIVALVGSAMGFYFGTHSSK
jgi:hypothetical protein